MGPTAGGKSRTQNRYLLCRTLFVSVATDSHAADKISRCQTEIEGRGAASWRGPPGRPEKEALDRDWGAEIAAPAPARAARPKSWAAEQRAGGGPRGAPKKRHWTAIRARRDSVPHPRAMPDRYRGPRSSALAGAPGAPRKSGLGPLFGGGGRASGPRPRALPDRYRGPRSSLLAGAPRGAPKSGIGPLFGRAEIAACTRARCQTDMEGRGAARWRWPPVRPEKAALDRYSGGAELAARTRVRCQTDIEGRGAARWRWPPGLPEKAALDRLGLDVLRTGPPPLYRRVS